MSSNEQEVELGRTSLAIHYVNVFFSDTLNHQTGMTMIIFTMRNQKRTLFTQIAHSHSGNIKITKTTTTTIMLLPGNKTMFRIQHLNHHRSTRSMPKHPIKTPFPMPLFIIFQTNMDRDKRYFIKKCVLGNNFYIIFMNSFTGWSNI